MFDLDHLEETGDIAGFIAILRHAGASASRRAEAAERLTKTGKPELIEILIRACKADPLEIVQDAAFSGLSFLAGADAALAVSAYPMSLEEVNRWLVDTPSEEEVLSILIKQRDPILMDFITWDPDFQINGLEWQTSEVSWEEKPDSTILVTRMRNSRLTPQERADAALQLGTSYQKEESESLIRAMKEDPDRLVQEAARNALFQMHGNEANLVIASYQHAFPYVDGWLEEQSAAGRKGEIDDTDYEKMMELDTIAEDGYFGEVNRDVFNEFDYKGLAAIINGDAQLDLRIKAVKYLQRSRDPKVVDWLIQIALHDEKALQDTARQVLSQMFPEDYEQMLAESSEAQDLDTDEPSDETSDVSSSEEAGDEKFPGGATRQARMIDGIPAVSQKEGNLSWLTILTLVVIAAVILYLFLQ